jgi:hypothetical protein
MKKYRFGPPVRPPTAPAETPCPTETRKLLIRQYTRILNQLGFHEYDGDFAACNGEFQEFTGVYDWTPKGKTIAELQERLDDAKAFRDSH